MIPVKLDGQISVLKLHDLGTVTTPGFLNTLLFCDTVLLVFLLPSFFSFPFLGSFFCIHHLKSWGFPGNTVHSLYVKPAWMISFILMASVIIYMLMISKFTSFSWASVVCINPPTNIVCLEVLPALLIHFIISIILSNRPFFLCALSQWKYHCLPGCVSQNPEHHPRLLPLFTSNI